MGVVRILNLWDGIDTALRPVYGSREDCISARMVPMGLPHYEANAHH